MQQKNKILKKIETNDFIVAKREDGLYHIFIKDYVVVNLKVQSEMLAAAKEITEGGKGFFIYEAGHKCNVTKEARDNSIVIENESPNLATCVYVQNTVYRMIALFFSRINKPKQPFWAAGDFQEGINWLKSIEKTQLIPSGK